MTFARWVKSAREQKKLRQEECARRAGIHQSVWSDYETAARTPRRSTALKIADALGVPAAEALEAAGYRAEDTLEAPAVWMLLWETIARNPPDKQERILRAVQSVVEIAG